MKVLLVLLGLSSVCFGRIGETLERCKERYGEEMRPGGTTHTFEKNKIVISLLLDAKGKCKSIVYAPNGERHLAPEESEGFLSANLGKGKWQKSDKAISHWIKQKGYKVEVHWMNDAENTVAFLIQLKDGKESWLQVMTQKHYKKLVENTKMLVD